MTNQTPTPEKTELKKTEKNTQTGSSSPTHKKSSKGWIFVLILLLILIGGAGAGGWFGYQQWLVWQADFEQKSTELTELQSSLKEQQARNNQISSQLSAIRKDNGKEIQDLRQELMNTARRVTESQGVTRYEWLLAEAEYLLRLAQQRIKLEHDAEGALAILQSADAVLRDSKDAGLIDVRAALAEEMASLATVKNVDKTGIYLELAALETNILKWTATPDFEPAAPAAGDSSNQVWWKNWLSRMDRYFSVRKHEEENFRPITTQEFDLNRNILLLQMEQAQSAVLRQDQKAFDHAVTQAQIWADRYFAHLTQADLARKELGELKGTQLNEDIPEIGRSLILLKGYIAQVYALQRHAPSEQAE